jgi:uncharacterized lipoprotein YajG
MNPKHRLSASAILAAALLLGGCATSRSIIDVPLPAAAATASANGKEIKINSVTDKRVFEVSPSEPSTPSLDPSEEQGDRIKARAIARKRNSYGRGLGDILLPEGKTVESLIENALRQAFAESGYKVLGSKEPAAADTPVVDARIEKLWSWMNPGFIAITLSSEIATEIEIKTGAAIRKEAVAVKSSDSFQVATESNWLMMVQRALKAYVDELKLRLK